MGAEKTPSQKAKSVMRVASRSWAGTLTGAATDETAQAGVKRHPSGSKSLTRAAAAAGCLQADSEHRRIFKNIRKLLSLSPRSLNSKASTWFYSH